MIFWEFHSGPYLWNAFILLLSCDASLSFLSSTLVTAIAASELWNDTTVLAQIFTDRCRFSSLLSYLFGIRQQHVWFWSNALLKYKGVLFYQHVCIKSCFKLGKNVSFLNGFSTQNWHDLCRSCQMFKKSINSKTDKKKMWGNLSSKGEESLSMKWLICWEFHLGHVKSFWQTIWICHISKKLVLHVPSEKQKMF